MIVYDLSKGAIFNNLERLLPLTSSSRHYESETVRVTNIISMESQSER